jgi:hypothetical protein
MDAISLERLDFFRGDHVAQCGGGGELVVQETAEDGFAEVRFAIPADRIGLSIRLSGQEGFPFLQSARNADGHLLIEATPGKWQAHIIECKRTVRGAKWPHIVDQLCWSMVRLQIVADFLRLPIVAWRFHIAYREDKISQPTNPAFLKTPVGAIMLPEQRALHAWTSRTVPAPTPTSHLAPTVPLSLIPLDSDYKASISLP